MNYGLTGRMMIRKVVINYFALNYINQMFNGVGQCHKYYSRLHSLVYDCRKNQQVLQAIMTGREIAILDGYTQRILSSRDRMILAHALDQGYSEDFADNIKLLCLRFELDRMELPSLIPLLNNALRQGERQTVLNTLEHYLREWDDDSPIRQFC